MTNFEYLESRKKLDANTKAAKEWMKVNKTNGIPSEIVATFPHASEINNELRSAIEVHEWLNDAPKKYTLYVREVSSEAITWMGDKLGHITFGRPYHDNFGGTRVPVTVHGTNGVTYYGTYFKSSGDYANIKAKK